MESVVSGTNNGLWKDCPGWSTEQINGIGHGAKKSLFWSSVKWNDLISKEELKNVQLFERLMIGHS